MLELSLLYTISIDGFIADRSGKTPFSSASWRRYLEIVRTYRHLVMGRTTYELFLSDPTIKSVPFLERHVLSRRAISIPESFRVHRSVEGLAAYLAGIDGKDVVVIGGASVGTALLNARLISHITFLIDPLLLGEGVRMFTPEVQIPPVQQRSMSTSEDGFIEVCYEIER
jgi:dihydrofolate reductase